jgi:nitroreductase
MELFDAIASRSTAKGLSEPGPTPEHLERLLQAAAHAPDHGRLKPWRFIAVNGAARESFANAVAEARRDQIPTFTDEQMELEREKIRRSPSILVVGCAVRKDMAKVPEIEQVIAVGAAVENLLLAANDLGYGVMWKTGAAAYSTRVKAAVGLAADDHIVAILHLGTKIK